MSRGARSVTMVERDRTVAQRLRDNVALLRESDKVVVRQQDAMRFLQTPPDQPFDVVFLDPPFADDCLAMVCDRLVGADWLSSDCAVYLEQDASRPWAVCPASLRADREGRALKSLATGAGNNVQPDWGP